jgi:ferredoxin-nitrite reductase
MESQEFSPEQKQYLQGFLSGSNLARVSRGLPELSSFFTGEGADSYLNGSSNGHANGHANGQVNDEVTGGPPTPDKLGWQAQNQALAAGKKLTEQEEAKRKVHPLDQWDDIAQHAAESRFPKGLDVLSFKYHGLFFVAPTQNSYMTRLRFPNGVISSAQMRAVADIAENQGGNYAHVTTRSNLQIREIKAEDALLVLEQLHESGIVNKGAGADNIRNITGSVTAGIDPQELIDTRPLTRAMNHYILNHREMYGLPRKFNIAFDGGGTVHTLEDTNDIGFQAVRVGPGHEVPEGIYFRVMLGGITGHQDFARDTGLMVTPDQCVPLAAAIVRVFIDEGDRTDRKKARLKYVIDRLGLDGVMNLTKKYLSFEPTAFPLEKCEPRPPAIRNAHIGVHPQKQDGKYYIGVVLSVGKLTPEQMRRLADLSDQYGSREMRLTVWQNLLIPNINEADLETVKSELETVGLHWDANNIRGGLIACTGSFGCKFGLADTKATAMRIAEYVETRLQLDQPINIHLTGCPHSCAQHYIGDIGLLGVKVEMDDDMVDGFSIFVGGGYGEDAGIGREIFPNILVEEVPFKIEAMLRTYQDNREGTEAFVHWARRHETNQLKELFESHLALA